MIDRRPPIAPSLVALLLLCFPLPAEESLRLAVAPPPLLDMRPETGNGNELLRALLFDVLLEELEQAAVLTAVVADSPLESAELVQRSARMGYRFALAGFIIREPDRIGLGLNVYRTDDGYVITGRYAFGASELALSRALARELQTLASDLHSYLETAQLESETAVRSITFVTVQPDVTLTLADGRSWNTRGNGTVVLSDVPYRIGQTIAVTAGRDGYYSRSHTYRLGDKDVRIEVPPLTPRTRFSAGIRVFPAYIQGGGAAVRWYPLPDELFVELSGAFFLVAQDSQLAQDIESELDHFQSDAISTFGMTDLSLSVGAYLFFAPGHLLRPGVQVGAGAMRAIGDDWDVMLPYLAPLNLFVSLGRGRLRGRLVSSLRYTVAADVLDRHWLSFDGVAPYAWLEAAYTW